MRVDDRKSRKNPSLENTIYTESFSPLTPILSSKLFELSTKFLNFQMGNRRTCSTSGRYAGPLPWRLTSCRFTAASRWVLKFKIYTYTNEMHITISQRQSLHYMIDYSIASTHMSIWAFQRFNPSPLPFEPSSLSNSSTLKCLNFNILTF